MCLGALARAAQEADEAETCPQKREPREAGVAGGTQLGRRLLGSHGRRLGAVFAPPRCSPQKLGKMSINGLWNRVGMRYDAL